MIQLKEIVAKMEIIPDGKGLLQVNVEMPIWLNKTDEGIYITLALLGGIVTMAKNDEDIDSAMKEALDSFFYAAQKFGKGIDKELALLGWQKKKRAVSVKSQHRFKSNKNVFMPRTDNPMLTGVMQTGVAANINLQIVKEAA